MTEIYNFSPVTGEFLREGVADESPLEPGVALVPAFATTIKPPKINSREVAVFCDEQWHVKPDWRGVKLFGVADGQPVSIKEIGLLPAEVGATDQAMPSPAHTWMNGVWQIDPVKELAILNQAKADALRRVDAFAAGFRAKIAGTADPIEVAGWNNKLALAMAVKAGTAKPHEVAALQVEIDLRGFGETLDQFVAKVAMNAAKFSHAVGLIDGMKRRSQDAVMAAPSLEALDTVLQQMRLQAEAEYQKLIGAK